MPELYRMVALPDPVRDPGCGIRKPERPDHGSRTPVPGSAELT